VPKRSAGLLLYRWHEGRLEVFLVHPGGPFWARRNEGAWSIPKGGYVEHEDPPAAARSGFTASTDTHKARPAREDHRRRRSEHAGDEVPPARSDANRRAIQLPGSPRWDPGRENALGSSP